jgi:hypothetical protein
LYAKTALHAQLAVIIKKITIPSQIEPSKSPANSHSSQPTFNVRY